MHRVRNYIDKYEINDGCIKIINSTKQIIVPKTFCKIKKKYRGKETYYYLAQDS